MHDQALVNLQTQDIFHGTREHTGDDLSKTVAKYGTGTDLCDGDVLLDRVRHS